MELLEREGELAMARRLTDGAAEANGALAFVEGPAGVGKSSILRKTVVLAQDRGFDTANARASELEREFAFGLVRQLFEPKLARLGVADRREALSGAAGLAAPLFERLDADSLTPSGEASHATLHGLYWLTVNLATKQPLALAVDDLHWSDPPSLRFLAYLANRVDELPVLMVAGARPDEPGAEADLLEQLATSPSAHVIRPHPLSKESVAELIRGAVADPAPEFAAACFDATQGNPLLVRELLTTLTDERIEPTAEQAGVVLELASRSVARSVGLRLRRLGPAAEGLAQAVAVLGDGTGLGTAARLAGLEAERAPAAAEALNRADILRSEQVEFVHPVVRAAVYSRLASSERAERHRTAATILSELGADEDEVALHLIAGRPANDDWVVDVLRRAARRAHSRGAPDIGARYLLRALTEPPSAEQRPQILMDLGLAELATKRMGGLARMREALMLPEDPRVRARLALQLGRSLFLWLDYAGATEVLEVALAELPAGEDLLRHELEAQYLSACVFDGTLRAQATERVLALVHDSSGVTDPVMLATLSISAGIVMGPARIGGELAARALADGGLSFEENPMVLALATFALIADNRLEEARTSLDRAIEEATARGARYEQGFARTVRAYARLRLGEVSAAESDAAQALEGRPEGSVAMTRWIVPPIIDAMVERGGLDEASALIEEHRELWPLPDLPESCFMLQSTGRLRAAQRRFEEAIGDLRECGRRLGTWPIRNPGLLAWQADLAAVLVAAGKREEAREVADEAIDVAREFGVPRELGMGLRAAGLAEGGAAGVELLREAVAVLEGTEAELEHTRALVDLGAALRREGQRSDARDPLRTGLDHAQRLGATALAERAHEELVATGARPRRLMLSGADSLTASERRVAEMASEGLTNREIAQALFVTEKTVESHLGHAYRKLDIRSRAELPKALVRRPDTAPA
jgi:DNA-binding CsgD family transcriptional regulator